MIGLDITDISRFREMKNLEMFIRRCFTVNEADYFAKNSGAKNFYASVAGHYAAKEAFSKALGTGIRGFSLADIEICHDKLGKPYIKFGGTRVGGALTISHSDTAAAAVVVLPEFFSADKMPIYPGIDTYRDLVPKRESGFNKGDCGKVFIAAGSTGMSGAACLSAEGALRVGSGLVTVGLPRSVQPIAAIKLTEAMTVPLAENEDGTMSLAALGEMKSRISRSDICVFGPGVGRNSDISKLIDSLISGSCDMLIDADGLNAISENMDILRKHANRRSCRVVITPHPGEMSRLCGESIEAVQNDRVGTAARFAAEFGVTVVLKGEGTVIASPDGRTHINISGNPGMATGGTGDVLSGVIASLMGQGLEPFEASVLGTFVHGMAGDIASREKGEHGMTAGDLAERLPEAMRILSIKE